LTTSKIYITKQRLEQMITQTAREHDQYPKPILTILVALLLIIILAAVAVLLLVILAVALLYVFLSWIDVIIGKHIIKRIFK
jgi:hypothetical protein